MIVALIVVGAVVFEIVFALGFGRMIRARDAQSQISSAVPAGVPVGDGVAVPLTGPGHATPNPK